VKLPRITLINFPINFNSIVSSLQLHLSLKAPSDDMAITCMVFAINTLIISSGGALSEMTNAIDQFQKTNCKLKLSRELVKVSLNANESYL